MLLGWSEVLIDLKERGIEHVGLVLCDKLKSIENSVQEVFPSAHLQFCLLHKLRNITRHARHSVKGELTVDFQKVFALEDEKDTYEQLEKRMEAFLTKWGKLYPKIKGKLPREKWQLYASYLNYPVTVRRMLYTTNWIERFNKEVRKVTKHVNSFPNEDSMLNLLFFICQKMNKTYQRPVSTFMPVKHRMEEILMQKGMHNKLPLPQKY